MGWFKGRHFNEEGNLVTHHFTWATGMAYWHYKTSYFKTFKKIPPHWLLVSRTTNDRVDMLRAAIAAGKPLPELKNPMIFIFPDNFFTK